MILDNIEKNEKDYKNDLEIINRYMRRKNLDNELQTKIRNYIEFLYVAKSDISDNQDVQQVLEKLPLSITAEIKKNINQRIIK